MAVQFPITGGHLERKAVGGYWDYANTDQESMDLYWIEYMQDTYKTIIYTNDTKVFAAPTPDELMAMTKPERFIILLNVCYRDGLARHSILVILSNPNRHIYIFDPSSILCSVEVVYKYFEYLISMYGYVPEFLTGERCEINRARMKPYRADEMEGYCLIWALYFAETVLLNPNLSPHKIKDSLLAEDSEKLQRLIREYTVRVLSYVKLREHGTPLLSCDDLKKYIEGPVFDYIFDPITGDLVYTYDDNGYTKEFIKMCQSCGINKKDLKRLYIIK